MDHNPISFDAAVAIATGQATVLVAPTGSGKTNMAMSPPTHPTKLSIVVSPLQENMGDLQSAGVVNATQIPTLHGVTQLDEQDSVPIECS